MADTTDRDITLLEKKAGQKAARTIQRNWRSILGTATTKQTGVLLQAAGARVKMRFDALEAIEVRASSATFKQHYGFEGIKSNGIAMSMKPYDHFNHLFDKSEKAMRKLVSEITELRGEQITTAFRGVIQKESE